MKYFQGIADIEDHYKNILQEFKMGYRRNKVSLLETWGIKEDEEALIQEEREVLRYLIGCQLGFVRDSNVKKPRLDLVERCFSRHIGFLEAIYNVDEYTINKHSLTAVIREYKTCKHYLFKFSLPAWYSKMPDEILTLENKYPTSTEPV